MTNDVLKFARWVDEFEQRNPERKFASVEEAFGFYRAVETSEVGNYASAIEEFLSDGSKNKIVAEEGLGNKALSLEIVTRALTHEQGEYFYLVYAPGPDAESSVMDMSVKNGEKLVSVLASYALTQGLPDLVAKFTNIVSRILLIAKTHIHNETRRRAKNN